MTLYELYQKVGPDKIIGLKVRYEDFGVLQINEIVFKKYFSSTVIESFVEWLPIGKKKIRALSDPIYVPIIEVEGFEL